MSPRSQINQVKNFKVMQEKQENILILNVAKRMSESYGTSFMQSFYDAKKMRRLIFLYAELGATLEEIAEEISSTVALFAAD